MCPGLPLRARHSASLSIADSGQLTADVPARRRLRSTNTTTLLMPSTRRSSRAFPVAAARAWNSLPPATRAANSLHYCSFGERQKHICSDCHSLTDRKPLLCFTNCWQSELQCSTRVLHKFCKVVLQRPWCDSVTLVSAFLIIIILVPLLFTDAHSEDGARMLAMVIVSWFHKGNALDIRHAWHHTDVELYVDKT